MPARTLIIGMLGLLTGLCLAMVPPAAAAVMYDITDLGTLAGSDVTRATGINNAGQVIGYSGSALNPSQPSYTPTPHAFLWQNGAMQDLGTLPGNTFSVASGINAAGQVVGSSGTTNSVGSTTSSHPVLWQNGTIQDLGTLPGDTYGGATGINNVGQVVGVSSATGNFGHAFLWQNGTMQALSNPDPSYYGWTPAAINNLGQVAGTGEYDAFPRLDITGYNVVLWQNGTAQALTDCVYCIGTAMNNLGQVVAVERPDFESALTSLYVLQAGQNPILIGTDGANTNVTGINDAGQVVGVFQGSPFLWQAGVRQDLSTLMVNGAGWTSLQPLAINNNGWIVGNGIDNGLYHAFLLTPESPASVPEPTSLLLLGSGAAGLAARRHGSRPAHRRRAADARRVSSTSESAVTS